MVKAFRRLAFAIWGTEVDRALRPVIAVSFFGSLAGSTWWSFMGLWAIEQLDAKQQLPYAFLVGAMLAMISGFVGGHLSDYIGRRKVILFGQSVMVAYPLILIVVGTNLWPGLVMLMLAGVFGGLGGSASQAMVADLVEPAKHEAAYATVRVASNFGVVIGPPVGAILLFAGSWNLLFVGVFFLALIAWVLAYRLLPVRGAFAPEAPPDRGSLGVILRDRPFLLFLFSAIFAWLVYVAYQEILPISLVDGYGYEIWAWGFLTAINPLLVGLFQLRITRSLTGIPVASKLAAAMLMMGLPFLLLTATQAVWVVILVIVVFVVGEMVWVPTSQSVVAGLAPEDVRGAYMGAFGSAPAVAFALAPFIGLSVRNAWDDSTMWVMFASIAVVAATLGWLACQTGDVAATPEPESA